MASFDARDLDVHLRTLQCLAGCLQHDPDVRRMVGDGTFDDLTPEQRKEAVRICADHHPRLAQQLAATSACSWVGIFALVAASIPFYMMCCCTRAPAHAASGTVPVAEPAGEAAANPLRRGEEQQPLLSGRA